MSDKNITETLDALWRTCNKEPRLHWDRKKDIWVTDDKTCWVEDDIFISVPPGFETDLATVPYPFRPVFRTYGRHNRATIIHDYLYKERGFVDGHTFTRKQCDNIFLNIMKEDGVSKFYRYVMYYSVSVFNTFKKW